MALVYNDSSQSTARTQGYFIVLFVSYHHYQILKMSCLVVVRMIRPIYQIFRPLEGHKVFYCSNILYHIIFITFFKMLFFAVVRMIGPIYIKLLGPRAASQNLRRENSFSWQGSQFVFLNLTRIEYNQKQARFMFLFRVCHLITQAGNQLIWNFEGSHGGNLLELDERENLLSPVSWSPWLFHGKC